MVFQIGQPRGCQEGLVLLFISSLFSLSISCTDDEPRGEIEAHSSEDQGPNEVSVESGGELDQNILSPQAGAGGDEGGGVAGAQAGGDQAGAVGGEMAPMSCTWPADCEGGDCIDGLCRDDQLTTCRRDHECTAEESCVLSHCLTPCERDLTCPIRTMPCSVHQECPFGTVCFEDRCINDCLTDLECPEGGVCLNGACIPFPDDLLSNVHPTSDSSADELFVGIGITPLKYPIGVSLSGYGARTGRMTPYNQSLGGSSSVLERQDVRALAFDQAGEIQLLIRLPLAWSTDYLRTLIAIELQALTRSAENPQGINYLDALLIFATHSHSQPGRFWNLVPDRPLGVLGFGTFSPSITRKYAQVAAHAAALALEDLKPARIGWSIVDEADPERMIHSNRRRSTTQFDDRLLTMRIDDLEGQPRAAIVGFGVHGTHFMTPLLTGDAAAGIERIFTEELSRNWGTFVPTFFMNGNAGNISPRGDHFTNQKFGHIQTLGALLWEVFKDEFNAITTRSDLEVRGLTRRVPISYDLLGYGQDEEPDFQNNRGQLYRYGAFSCVNNQRVPGEDEPYTKEDPACAIPVYDLAFTPVPQFTKTVISAFRVGELLLTTLPGEPSSGLGLILAEKVEIDAIEAGLSQPRSFNIGYAQDHHFYLIEEEDWFWGGYEASMGVWGWREGGYLVEHAQMIVGDLLGLNAYPHYALKPTWWPDLEDDYRVPPSSLMPPVILTAPSSTIKRGQILTLEWSGGDPGVDLPWVELLSGAMGDQTTAHPWSGLPMNDESFETVIKYLGDYEEDQRWSLSWDLPYELSEGQYRVRLHGEAMIDGENTPYTLTTSTIEVTTDEAIKVQQMNIEPPSISLLLTYVNAPSNDDGESPFGLLIPQGTSLHSRSASALMNDRSPRALKEVRFVLGPPVLSPITVTLTPINSEPEGDPDDIWSTELRPTLAQCEIPVTLSRSSEGVDRVERVEGVLCGQLDVTIPEAFRREGAYMMRLTDEYTNRWEGEVSW